MIDEVHFADHVVLAAVGIDLNGIKHSLTRMGLRLPDGLELVPPSTNLIENLFGRVREIARRLNRWQGGTKILRWTAGGVLEAQRYFHKITGYRSLPKLAAMLHAHVWRLCLVLTEFKKGSYQRLPPERLWPTHDAQVFLL